MAVQSIPSEGTRPERPAGRPIGRRRRAMRSLRRLSLAQATALVVAGAAVTLTVLAVLVSWQTGRVLTALERAEHAATADQTRWQLQSLVGQDEARLADAAYSDELYDSLGDLAERRDSTFHPVFADPFSRQHRDQFIGVYDLQATPLYRWTASGSLGLEGTVVSNALFRILDNREATAGLLRRGDEVFWVAGAPVLPAGAPASAPIRGYVLTARALRPGDLSPVHSGRPLPVELDALTPSRAPARTVVSALAGGDSVRIVFPLSDIFAERTSEASIRADRAAFRGVEGRVQLLFVGTLVMIAALAVLGWWLARRWIVRPVTRFTQSLAPIHEGQTPTLLPKVSSAAEWQAAVGAVNRLLTQMRSTTERSERLVGIVRDGVWSCDIVTGSWTFNERCRELLGRDETSSPLDRAVFLGLIHPEQRAEALAALDRCTREGAGLDLEVQLRRRDGTFGWYRLAAQIDRDHNGAPAEMVGRLVSLDAERAGRDRTEALRGELSNSQLAHGRLLATIARKTPEAPWADDLAFVGRALSGTVDPVSEPFDLHQALQELANGAGAAVQVAISPGLATRVSGDRRLIGRALAPLLADAAAAGGDLSLRAERADGPDQVRLLVERRGGRATSEHHHTRLATMLGAGTTDDRDTDPTEFLGLQAAHHALAAIGATSDVGPMDGGGSRASVTLTLPSVAPEYAATELADFGDPAATSWQVPGEWTDSAAGAAGASIDAEPDPAEPRVELVADATVTINLDDPPPSVLAAAAARVIDPGFLSQLEPGPRRSILALRMATAFLKDAPERARGIRHTTNEGEVATARALAENLGGMAGLVTAEALAAACGAFVAAASESTMGLAPGLDAVDAALAAVTRELNRVVQPTAEGAVDAGPPINADTLAQLRASIAVDRLGLGGQLVSMFISEAPIRLEALERAAMGQDEQALRSTADDLKNMCNLVGAGTLGARCEALDGDAPRPAQVATIRAELARARQTLEELLQAGAHA